MVCCTDYMMLRLLVAAFFLVAIVASPAACSDSSSLNPITKGVRLLNNGFEPNFESDPTGTCSMWKFGGSQSRDYFMDGPLGGECPLARLPQLVFYENNSRSMQCDDANIVYTVSIELNQDFGYVPDIRSLLVVVAPMTPNVPYFNSFAPVSLLPRDRYWLTDDRRVVMRLNGFVNAAVVGPANIDAPVVSMLMVPVKLPCTLNYERVGGIGVFCVAQYNTNATILTTRLSVSLSDASQTSWLQRFLPTTGVACVLNSSVFVIKLTNEALQSPIYDTTIVFIRLPSTSQTMRLIHKFAGADRWEYVPSIVGATDVSSVGPVLVAGMWAVVDYHPFVCNYTSFGPTCASCASCAEGCDSGLTGSGRCLCAAASVNATGAVRGIDDGNGCTCINRLAWGPACANVCACSTIECDSRVSGTGCMTKAAATGGCDGRVLGARCTSKAAAPGFDFTIFLYICVAVVFVGMPPVYCHVPARKQIAYTMLVGETAHKLPMPVLPSVRGLVL